jgi:Cu2+-exporting ATPase
LNMDVSVSIAIGGAFAASCVATVQGTGEVYFESVSMFTFFLLLGRYFEQNARRRASISSGNLHKLVPLTALKMSGNSTEEIPAKRLVLGDIILVRPGDTFAADGVIVHGHSSVNEAMLTGEQMPIDKPVDALVYAGTINVEQPLQMKVTALGQDQLVAEIIRLQEIAATNKPAIALLADKLARYFSASILSIALVTYLVWLQISPEDAFWVTLSVLVATCPCALALATPTAVTCASSIFTRLGIISRRTGVFEKLAKINHVVFDKTGTLTCGQITLGDVTFVDNRVDTSVDSCVDSKVIISGASEVGLTARQVLAYGAALEAGSLHPIAQAFLPYSNPKIHATQLQHKVALGIEGTIKGHRYRIGNLKFLAPSSEKPPALIKTNKTDKANATCPSQGVWFAQDDEIIAFIAMADNLRPDSKHTVTELQQSGIDVSIASGDSQAHVAQLANTLGVSNVYAEQSPKDKLNLINKLQETQSVAMFGDGINDAPVLAGAYLSVAMGSGTAIAKNSADLILLGDHLSRFVQALAVANKTNAIIKQNLLWAFGYNALILPLAVTGHVAPYIAAIGMSLSSIIVVSNSLRLLRTKI